MSLGRSPVAPLLVSLGLATLCSFPFLTPLASSHHLAIFHLGGAASLLFIPPLVYFVCFWLIFAGLLWAGRRHERVRLAVWAIFLSFLPWLVTKTIAVSLGRIVPASVTVALLLASLFCFAIVVAAPWRDTSSWLLSIIHVAETVLTLVAWTGILLIGEVLWFFFAARHHGVTPGPVSSQTSHSTSGPSPVRPRVIWILLDELSYDQTFGHRFPGLVLPAFDQLRAQSTLFTHVVPAGTRTERVVPALITGIAVEHIKSSADGNHLVLVGSDGQTTSFNAHNNVFSDALLRGYHSGVTGWYNPYCRLLAGVLDRCIWSPHHDTLPGGFRTDAGIERNLAAPLLSALRFAGRSLAPGFGTLWNDRLAMDEHIEEFRDLDAGAQSMLSDPSLDFLFLHMAVPHPEGIYDRRQQRVVDTGKSSYIDNLALADRVLQEMMDGMQKRGEWDGAAVIVMGDHSWRTRDLWRQLPGWTSEDERASHGGHFDERPAYLVKLPDQHAPAQVDTSFSALRTRSLLNGIFTGSIRSTADLRAWVAEPSQPSK